jgi:hypothetical protein
MDGVRGHAGWPPDDTLLGWDQRERSGAKHWQRLHDTPLQAVGISTCHQLGSPFRESSSASVKRRAASAASFLKVNGFCFSCAHPISNKGLRASHRKRPRQIFDHQKLHSSVCLHNRLLSRLRQLSWICLDCDAIPTLIASVLRGTNVNEFLERLDVLAYMGK